MPSIIILVIYDVEALISAKNIEKFHSKIFKFASIGEPSSTTSINSGRKKMTPSLSISYKWNYGCKKWSWVGFKSDPNLTWYCLARTIFVNGSIT